MSGQTRARRAQIVSCGVLAAASLFAIAGCSRNNIEAINLANEGDKEKASNPEDAIAKYQQAVQLDPTNHKILWKLALAYAKKEDWSNVTATCSKAEDAEKHANKDNKPSFANYYWEDGYAMKKLALAGSGNWQDAKSRFEQCIAIDPNYADAYEDLGEVLYHLDDEQGALQNYSKAIELKPDNTDFYAPLASLYFDLAFFDLAEQVLKVPLSPDSQFAKEGDKNLFGIHAGLGNVYDAEAAQGGASASGKVASAITEFEAAKKACGDCQDHKEAYFYLGNAYAEATPVRQDGIAQLRSFYKIACKGAQAKKYEELCTQASEIASRKYNSPLQ